MRERVTTLLSGSFLEGPARRAYSAVRSHVPAALLSAATSKARDYDRMTIEIARVALADGGTAVDVLTHSIQCAIAGLARCGQCAAIPQVGLYGSRPAGRRLGCDAAGTSGRPANRLAPFGAAG
jgi:hypothetical protein